MSLYLVGIKSKMTGEFLVGNIEGQAADSVTVFKSKKNAKHFKRQLNDLWRIKGKVYKLVKI